MSLAWLILLLAWPLLEIAVLVKAGSWLGLWPTLGIVAVTGILGAAVLCQQGLEAARKVQEAMLEGEAPLQSMLNGALLATAGVLLLLPGLMGDVAGLLLLVPGLRSLAARYLVRAMLGLSEVDMARARPDPRRRTGSSPGDGPIIEGEFERLDERTIDPKRGRDRDRN